MDYFLALSSGVGIKSPSPDRALTQPCRMVRCDADDLDLRRDNPAETSAHAQVISASGEVGGVQFVASAVGDVVA